MSLKSIILLLEIVIGIVFLFIVGITWYSLHESDPERLGFEKDTSKYKFVKLALADAAYYGSESPPFGLTLRKVTNVRETSKNTCENSTVYTGELAKMEATIEEKHFLGLLGTKSFISSCAGVRELK